MEKINWGESGTEVLTLGMTSTIQEINNGDLNYNTVGEEKTIRQG